MKKTTQLSTFLLLILSANTYSMEQSWPRKAVSNFVDCMLNTTTYVYKSPKHVISLICMFALPQSIGQYMLYKQRSNMKTFLKQNEASKLEKIRKHYDINPKKWQKAIQKAQADLHFNLQAMREPGNNYNTYHDPSLSKEWITAIHNECQRYDININNLNLTFDGTSDKVIATAKTHSPSPEGKYTPADITKYNHPKISAGVIPLEWITAHEMTHVMQGHSLYVHNAIAAIAPPITLPTISTIKIPDMPYWYDHFFPDRIAAKQKELEEALSKSKEALAKSEAVLKNTQERITILASLLEEPVYKEYIAAIEKTADTYLCCDDPIVTAHYIHAKNILRHNQCESYPANENDIAVLNANWKTAQAIENSRKIYRHIMQQPENLIAQLTYKSQAYVSDIVA